MFSQSNEDQIVAHIFNRIGEGGRVFTEFGCGKGDENNTIALLKRGWSGTWIEPWRKKIRSVRKIHADYIRTGRLRLIRKFVRPGNVFKFVTDPLDFLSIDIDGDDYAVWQAVTAKPRVVCIEYDAVAGTALEPIKVLGEAKGYSFWGVSESQVNAFFIAQ